MPLYDYACPQCCARVELLAPYGSRDSMCCAACGHTLQRFWDIGRAPHVRPDSIPGGRVIENLTRHAKRYYSHSEIKLAMQVAGVESFVRHVGEPGSDKSKHTTRWAGMDAQTLVNATALVERSMT